MTPHSMALLHAATAGAQHTAVVAPKPPPAPKNSGGGGGVSTLHPQQGATCRRDTRRAFLQGLAIAAAGAGASLLGAVDAASAASKRRTSPPPPPPPSEEEKKDPNVSGVLAKVMASRKRKEAMKENVAKLREKGKPVATP